MNINCNEEEFQSIVISYEMLQELEEEFNNKHPEVQGATLRIMGRESKEVENDELIIEDVNYWWCNGDKLKCTYNKNSNTFTLFISGPSNTKLEIGFYQDKKYYSIEFKQIKTIEIIDVLLGDLKRGDCYWTEQLGMFIMGKDIIIRNCTLFDNIHRPIRDGEFHVYARDICTKRELLLKNLQLIDCTLLCDTIESNLALKLHMEHLKVVRLNAPELKNIQGVFSNTEWLESLELIDCNFPKLYNVESAFENNKRLEKLDITNSFSNSPLEHMDNMFKHNTKLTEIIGVDTINLSRAFHMQYMFKDCIRLKRLNLSNLGINHIASKLDISGMLMNCKRLKEINLENIHNITSIYNISNTFYGLPKDCKIKLTQPISALRYNSKNKDEFELYYDNSYEPIEGTDKLSLKEFELYEQYFELNNKSLECVTYAITDTSNISSIDLETLNVIPLELSSIDDIQRELAKASIFNEIMYQRNNCVLTYSEESNTLKIIAKEIKKIEDFKG